MKKYYSLVATAALLAGMTLTSCKEKAAEKTEEETEKTVLVEETIESMMDSTKTSIVYEYDDMGHLLRKVTGPGSTEEFVEAYTYDEAGRMLTWHEKYADGTFGMYKTYQYNEKGDTLLAVLENCNSGDKEVLDKTTYEYDQDNRLIHKYEYHAYMPEGEFCEFSDMVKRYDYDKDGRLTATSGCDVEYGGETEYPSLKLSKTLPANPADEYSQLLAQRTMTKPVVRTYTYNGKGALSEATEDETHTTYTYNEQGKLTRIHSVTRYPDDDTTYESSILFEYDKAGHCIKEENVSEGYGYINYVEYNAQGDTAMFVNTELPDNNVYSKQLRLYHENGKLKDIYRFRGETLSWGYENNIAEHEIYDEQGLLIQKDTYQAAEDFITIERKSTLEPEAEFKALLKKFGYKLLTTTRYKYSKLQKS